MHKTPRRADSQQFSPELVVGDFGKQNHMNLSSAAKPLPHHSVPPWMAALPKDAGVEQQSHVECGRIASDSI